MNIPEPTVLAAIAVLLCLIFKLLNLTSQPQVPKIFSKDKNFVANLLKACPLLVQPYIPTRLWGYNGHIQTIVHSIIGRVRCPWPIGERIELKLKDGSTLTYDVYQPVYKASEDITLVIVPGICNSSESVYVRTFVHYSQCHGFRCAVLNHIGALSSVPLSSSRIFTYGYTSDLGAMVSHLNEKYSSSKLVCIGYSMGGNTVTKYLGEEDMKRPSNIIGGISICQGYDIIKGTKLLLQWQNFRRLYLYVITEAMKAIILRNRNMLLSEEVKKKYNLIEKEVVAAATLPELDDSYTRKVYNYPSLSSLYKWSSSCNYIKTINIPMIYINALDDPLVPEELLIPMREFASQRENVAYIEVSHGGHLGFYEGGTVYPNPISWLDKLLLDIVTSIDTHNQKPTNCSDCI